MLLYWIWSAHNAACRKMHLVLKGISHKIRLGNTLIPFYVHFRQFFQNIFFFAKFLLYHFYTRRSSINSCITRPDGKFQKLNVFSSYFFRIYYHAFNI